MAKKLGRGLSHLLSTADSPGEKAKTVENPDYQEIPIEKIKPNPEQPRKRFNEKDIEELSQTLKSVGLIEPIVVRQLEDEFLIVSGERRWRACRMAGFKKIPAVIKRINDVQALEMGIIENIQREDLNPIEEARAYDTLLKMTGLKPSAVADKVGKDRTTITNLIRLLKLPDQILELIEQKQISAGQARPLLGLGDKTKMLQLAKKIVIQGWSARRVEDEVSNLTDPVSAAKSTKKAGAKKDPNVKSMEEKIRSKYMAKVQVEHKKTGAGKISIHYGNLDDMDRILELLGVKK